MWSECPLAPHFIVRFIQLRWRNLCSARPNCTISTATNLSMTFFFNCIKTYINKQITSCLFLQFSVSFNNLRVSISKYFHSPYSQSSPLKPLRHLHSYWCSPRSIHVALCLHGFSFPHSLTTENQSTLYCSKVFNKISRVHIQNRENFFTIA